MTLIEAVLLTFLVVAAIAICVAKYLLASVIIFASYNLIMSMLWILLAAPDLALTEAAVGTGITGALYFVVIKRIRAIEQEHREEECRKNAAR